jgi:hypothetical protein
MELQIEKATLALQAAAVHYGNVAAGLADGQTDESDIAGAFYLLCVVVPALEPTLTQAPENEPHDPEIDEALWSALDLIAKAEEKAIPHVTEDLELRESLIRVRAGFAARNLDAFLDSFNEEG